MFLFSWGKLRKTAPLPEIKPEPVRGGLPAAIRLCESDRIRAYNTFCRAGIEQPVDELNDRRERAVDECLERFRAKLNDLITSTG